MKVGSKLRSTSGTTEVVVTRAPSSDVLLTCAGAELGEVAGPAVASGADSDILLGKRYVDEESGLELLCSKPGPGPLVADGRELVIKGAKPLPASD